MRKILFVVNPAAGNGSAKNVLPIIKKVCEGHKINYEIKVSNRKNQITQLVSDATKYEKYTDVVAVGGDGTIVESINGIIDNPIHFGLIPMGTGNDLARSLGIPLDPEKALYVIIHGELATIDLGRVNGVTFINSAGIGIDGNIINDTSKIKNYVSGSAAYLLSTLKSIITFKPFRVKLILDGVKLQREAYLIAIGNGKYFGGGMKITPDAELHSGEFQICLVRKLSRGKFLRIFPKVYQGKHMNAPEVEMFTCKEIIIESLDRELFVSADGNLVSKTPASIEISESKLEVWN